MQLRDYQEEAVDSAFDYFERRSGDPLIVAPTGAGKSVIIAGIIKEAMRKYRGTRVIVCTHVQELVEQNAQKMRVMCPEFSSSIGVYSAGLNMRDTTQAIVFAGIQSIYRRARALGHRDLIIVDEAHMIPKHDGGMYRRFIRDSRIVNENVRVLGMTATPFRTDSGLLTKGSDKLFTSVCYDVDIVRLVDEGYLSPLTTEHGAVQYDTTGVQVRGGEFLQSQLARVLSESEDVTRDALADVQRRGADRKSWVVFCASVAQAELSLEILQESGVSSALITGTTDKVERAATIAKFKRGEIKCLVNVNVLTTGFDAPQIDLIALLRPTKSPVLYCLDDQTEVLTKSGFKKKHEISVGDLVAAPCPSLHTMDWLPVTNILDRPAREDEFFVEYKSPHMDFRVTDRHRMLWRNRTSGFAMTEAASLLERSDDFYLPTSCFSGSPGVKLTHHDLSFLGWFMSDGTLNSKNRQITITQSKRYPHHIDHIRDTIKGCGFKYGEGVRPASTTFGTGYLDSVVFTVSRGPPRGRDKHLTGWGRLEPYISKDIPDSLLSVSSEQLAVLLNALHLGDGSKYTGGEWEQKSYHICTKNPRFADRLQSLCVVNGFSANISKRSDGMMMLHIKRQLQRNVSGQRNPHRPKLKRASSNGESVWCVSNDNGTLITRRNGKTMIMGNCQMLGRGMRIADGKDDCLVLDYGSNLTRHGPINKIRPKPQGEGDGQAPIKVCGECLAEIAAGFRRCPECDFEFPEPEIDLRRHRERGEYIQRNEQWYDVTKIKYSKHIKAGKPPSFKVEYYSGLLAVAAEWVCVEHFGFAKDKAVSWFKERAEAWPTTVDEALEMVGDLAEPKRILVDNSGKYPRVKKADFVGESEEDHG